MDITAAYQARQAGRRREVDLHRGALRLTDQALAELRGHIEQFAARFADPAAELAAGPQRRGCGAAAGLG